MKALEHLNRWLLLDVVLAMAIGLAVGCSLAGWTLSRDPVAVGGLRIRRHAPGLSGERRRRIGMASRSGSAAMWKSARVPGA